MDFAPRSEHPGLHEACGVVGVWDAPDAATLTYLGLYALQHRGQESAGIVTFDAHGHRHVVRRMGLVNDIFKRDVLDSLAGNRAIGHVRYSTSGGSTENNIQPFVATSHRGMTVAAAHNGNLTNTFEIRVQLEAEGVFFEGTTDTEVLLRLWQHRYAHLSTVDGLMAALREVRGAYSMLFLTDEGLIAARDPHGFRPLWIGQLRGTWMAASETCAFDLLEATPVREVEPGEVVLLTSGEPVSFRLAPADPSPCVFEFIYFARPDSNIFGSNVDAVRRKLGRQLAIESPADADIVISVPDSSNTAALGFAQQSGIPYELGFIRNHYVGRTFIKPSAESRHFGVRVKFNPVRDIIAGQRVAVIDDSIVRGTTCEKLVRMLYEAGAKEVHLRIASPPIAWPCFYGIDTPSREHLIAAKFSVEQIARQLGVDSLQYLSIDGVFAATGHRGFCTACFSGRYPEFIADRPGVPLPAAAVFPTAEPTLL